MFCSQQEVEIPQSQLHACQKLEIVPTVPHPRSSFWVTIALFLTAYVDSGVQTEAEPQANSSCLKDMEGVSVPESSRVHSPKVLTQKKTASTEQIVTLPQSAGSHLGWLFSFVVELDILSSYGRTSRDVIQQRSWAVWKCTDSQDVLPGTWMCSVNLLGICPWGWDHVQNFHFQDTMSLIKKCSVRNFDQILHQR